MSKVLFKITSKISYELDGYALRLVENGKKYYEHKKLFHFLDELSRKIYNFGYNKFILGGQHEI